MQAVLVLLGRLGCHTASSTIHQVYRILLQCVCGRVPAVSQAGRRLQPHAFESTLGLQLGYRLFSLVDLLVHDVHLGLNLFSARDIVGREQPSVDIRR